MDTIKSSPDITELFTQGRRINTAYLTFIVLERRDSQHLGGRVAFIAGKKFGNAVWRNAAKRRMREIARVLQAPWPGYDVVFLAKQNIMAAEYNKIVLVAQKAIANDRELKRS